MASDTKFGMLRKILRAIGLSQQASDDAVNFIVDLLAGDSKGSSYNSIFPYHMRDNFLSPAELSFYNVLKPAVDGNATICTKVNLNDIFYVRQGDPSQFRIYTNKIDRKHVDFVLCDPVTMQPIVALELDDKSHQRKDRQERDAFVDSVFEAAGLPLIHVTARRDYKLATIKSKLEPYLKIEPSINEPIAKAPLQEEVSPTCPKCGSTMILRTAKKGENIGNQFWGCPNYPKCRTILAVE